MSKLGDLKIELQVLDAMMNGYDNEDPPDYLYAARDGLTKELEMEQAKEANEANEIKYPDVHVKLIGTDGNVYALIGKIATALRRAKGAQAAGEFQKEAMSQSSYDAVLALIMRTVDVQ